jgi:hypothetical protein
MKLVGVTPNASFVKLLMVNTAENTLPDLHMVTVAILVCDHYIFVVSGKT